MHSVNRVDFALVFCLLLLGGCVALPWLNPFAPGPTSNLVPMLVSGFCAEVALIAGWLALRMQCQVDRLWNVVAWGWMVAACLNCVAALCQYLGWAEYLSPYVNSARIGEAYSNLRQRNLFATLTGIGLLAALTILRSTTYSPFLHRIAWTVNFASPLAFLGACGAVLLAAGNAASGSRTGFLQWMAIVGLSVVWRKHVPRYFLVWATAAFLLYLIAVSLMPLLLKVVTGLNSDGLLGRLDEKTGCASRKVLWANVLYLISLKPLLGWGWGELDYAHFITLYPGERFCDILDNAHNLPLHLAVELGVPFAVVATALVLWVVIRAKPWMEPNPARQLAWGVLAVIGLHSMVEYPLWYGPFQMAVVFSMILLMESDSNRRGALSLGVLQMWLRARVAGAVIVAVAFGLAYTGWDYWRISQLYLPQSQRADNYKDDTLAKVRSSRLFRDQVEFAELTTTLITTANAELMHALALDLLHFSPEPRVIEKVIESAVMLRHDDEAVWFLARYKAAFPQAHANWVEPSTGHKAP